MGVPKALMRVGGRPWCQQQRLRLRRVGLPVTWVLSAEVMRAARRSPSALRGIRPVVLGDSRFPMFHSLLVGIVAARSRSPGAVRGGVFVLPIDVPAPRPEVWRVLGRRRSVAVPWCEGRSGHPVYLPWSWIDRVILSGARGAAAPRLDKLIRKDHATVKVQDPDIAVNLNTPAEVRAWLGTSLKAPRRRTRARKGAA